MAIKKNIYIIISADFSFIIHLLSPAFRRISQMVEYRCCQSHKPIRITVNKATVPTCMIESQGGNINFFPKFHVEYLTYRTQWFPISPAVYYSKSRPKIKPSPLSHNSGTVHSQWPVLLPCWTDVFASSWLLLCANVLNQHPQNVSAVHSKI